MDHDIKIALLEERLKGIETQQEKYSAAQEKSNEKLSGQIEKIRERTDEILGTVNAGKGAYKFGLAISGFFGAMMGAFAKFISPVIN